jgi:hypothetical protein
MVSGNEDTDPKDSYEDADAEVVHSRRRPHRNGETTEVVVIETAEVYIAQAIDLDESQEVISTENIGTALTENEAVAKAGQWAADHPKGVEGDGGFSFLS